MNPNEFEKTALKSKKFLAFILIEFGLLGLMVYMVSKGGYEGSLNFSITIITAGFLASFFIGGQALVDRYTRVAQITRGPEQIETLESLSSPVLEKEESNLEDFGSSSGEETEEK